ncbi:MAG: hypothetical protein R3D05_08200 [Dongiaceae bacterium]
MMNRLLMAAAVTLVASGPLAFAATNMPVNPAQFSTRECSVVLDQVSHAKYKTETARQLTMEEASSVCRQSRDRPRNGPRPQLRPPFLAPAS